MRKHRLLLVIILVLWGVACSSFAQVRVVALFTGKAMISVDGQRHLLKVGERSPEGVLLVTASPHEAVLDVDGERGVYQLGGAISGSYQPRQKVEVTLWRDTSGAYNTVGSINGQNVSMVVDTGATTVAMSEITARGLGIAYRLEGDKTWVRTASGRAKAYAVKLQSVQVGGLGLRDVPGVVIQGNSPPRVLLGMSFLNQVDMQKRGNKLILKEKF